MANKTVFVSDIDGKELSETKAVKVTVTDKANASTYIVDASRDDALVKQLMEVGRKQAVRGRKSDKAKEDSAN